ncbi:hypothetical protein PVAR5_0948 [Paecilomyces variotii No. 5]|uniref:Uncharacterized protein n=1 Tax=Byssochlamys spectabilis (strain No. 5 / NBRC 109023) TaxID=1356009 RepID=V5FUU5_BYSSN|nr:hypothetical protein PVAR5_0948 [Paecilomyces variotii No. 5]
MLGGSLSLLDALETIIPSMEWKSNVRVGRGDNAVIISAGIANRLTPYILCHDYSNSRTARLFSEIYDFQFDEKVIADYRNLQAERTDEKADVKGMHYGPDEVPVGLLKKALALENEGFNIEFCTDYFRAQYGVAISSDCLRKAAEDTRILIAEEARQFDNGNRTEVETEQYNSGIGQPEDTQHRITRSFVGEVAISEALALQQSGGRFSEQGYPTNVADVIQKSRRGVEETTRTVRAGGEPSTVAPSSTGTPMSSSKFSEKLHGIGTKLARLAEIVLPQLSPLHIVG